MKNKANLSNKHPRRPLSELNLLDDFLFQEMISQKEDGEEFCRILLNTILDKPIRKVRIIPQMNVLGKDTGRHGIRMDVYIEDVSEGELLLKDTVDACILPDIYDIEPTMRYEKQTLPKRVRYYHGLIDTQLLASNVDYDKLQNVVIIIILPYDPFGKNRMIYTIQNQCMEDPSISYEDGAKKIFLYTKGSVGNTSQKLRDMLRYLENTSDEYVTNQDIDAIHHLVQKVKQRREVGIKYMKSWELEKLYRKEGREEGLEEGIKALVNTLQELGISEEQTIAKLAKNFSLESEDAKRYVEKYSSCEHPVSTL